MTSQHADLSRFIRELADDVSARVDDDSPRPEESTPEESTPEDRSTPADVALAEVMLEHLDEAGLVTAPEYCPFADVSGRRRCAITAYCLNDASDRLDLILAVFQPAATDGYTLAAADLAQLTGRAARFFDYAARGDVERFSGHPEVQDAVRRIHSGLRQIGSVRIFILTNARVKDREIDGLTIADIAVRFEIVDSERLFRLAQTATSRQDIDIDFVKIYGRPLACLEMQPRTREYDTYLAIFPATLLFDLYERFGQRLFEFNVRAFLQVTGKVNKGIRETLRSQPERFMAYDNGIVATADSLDVGLFHGELAISRLVGLQIVNGAQTTASLHRAKKIDKLDLTKVAVSAKITRVLPEKLQEFVPLISRFANTQNVVQVADLSANNEFHISLERLSQQIWCPGEETRWFYERARGAYADALQREGTTPARRRDFKLMTPLSQKLTKTDLAKHYMAWIGRPHIVSMGAQKNFSAFMSELPDLFPSGWEPDRPFYQRVIGQAILYRACERLVRARKCAAYRANISVYTYSLLSHFLKGQLDLDCVWDRQSISAGLEEFLSGLITTVDATIRSSAGSKNVTEWCKNIGCWEALRNVPYAPPPTLPPEFRQPDQMSAQADSMREFGIASAHSGWEDADAIEECQRYDASTWAKLSYWGISANTLDYYERGVAHTLSEYAASGWAKKPSPKQARIGLRVLSKARDADLLKA